MIWCMDGSFLTADSVMWELICASRLPRITALTRPPELITVALVKSMLVFTPIDMYILYQPHRGTFQKHLCVCLPDEKIYLKHLHILEIFASLMIYFIHTQLIRMFFFYYMTALRITRGPRGYNRHPRITNVRLSTVLILWKNKNKHKTQQKRKKTFRASQSFWFLD